MIQGAKFKTREEWLEAATLTMRHWIKEHGVAVPDKVYVGCGWVKGHGKHSIGVCYPGTLSADEKPHVWVCPTQNEPKRVLDILLHELIHAATPGEKHGGEFKRVAKAIGLKGRMTATIVEEGSELDNKLTILADSLGPYPHSELKHPQRGPKQPSKREQVRLQSIHEEHYTIQMRKERFEKWGAPVDPWGDPMVIMEKE